MKGSHGKSQRHWTRKRSAWAVALLAICALIALTAFPATAREDARQARAASDAVAEAWQRARDAGSYDFAVDIVQESIPLPMLSNVGRTSQETRLRLEGSTHIPQERMELVLWSQGGNVLDQASGVEVEVEGDRARVRQPGGDWQTSENFVSPFAPQGDFLTFLAAARDIREQGSETRALPGGGSLSFTRFTFRVDGRSYATHLRDQLQAHLIQNGDLPPDVTLDLSPVYANMSGTGELWIGADGLPLRQSLHLEFPPQKDFRVEARVTTDFSNFGDAPALAGAAPAAGFPGLGRLSIDEQALAQATMLLSSLAGFALLFSFSRSRLAYAAVVLAVIASMLVTPLLKSHQVAAFHAREAGRAREQEAAQQQSRMAQELQTLQASGDDAVPAHTALALARSDDGSDADRDRFTDVQELILQTDPHDARSRPDAAFNAAAILQDNGSDADGDGLTDYEESLLGTSSTTEDGDYDGVPDGVDTDGDGVGDREEVEGFSYNGQTWYGDPLAVDTNDDGLADGLEWNTDTHPTWDTDGDGTPDIHDRDNDGDGVPDDLDLSPFQAGGTGSSPTRFDGDTPFNLVVDGLLPGHPTYVEFQIRPTAEEHLWYAFNVLDWPEGDRGGQIQDADGKTFFDLCVEQGGTDCALSPDDNGDLRLVPMLEITLEGDEALANLPDAQTLQEDYGVVIQDLDPAGSQKAAYVPLQITADANAGDEHVAFYAKMLYLPASSWGNAQSVRLAWVIQALVDQCGYPETPPADYDPNWDWPPDPDDPPDDWPLFLEAWPPAEYQLYDGYQCQFHNAFNQTQIVQTYYDEWYLTGLKIRENAGVDIATVFEDPAVDPEPLHDTGLVRLVQGLEETLLVSRDCDEVNPASGECVGNGTRDLSVAPGSGDSTLAERFDHTQNAGLADELRWGISNTMRVETHSYAHLDLAYAENTQQRTPAVLDTHFSPHWQPAAPLSPTLLFVREERFRASNLDLQGADATIRWDDGDGDGHRERMTLDLDADGGTPQQTLVGLNWAPYRYNQDATAWEPYPLDDYWDEFARINGQQPDPADAEEIAAGKLMLAQLYYVMLFTGRSSLVQFGSNELHTSVPPKSDLDLKASMLYSIGKSGIGGAVVFIVNQAMMHRIQDQAGVVWRALGKLAGTRELTLAGDLDKTTTLRSLKSSLRDLRDTAIKTLLKLGLFKTFALLFIIITVVIVVTTLLINGFLKNDPLSIGILYAVGVAYMIYAKIYSPIKAVIDTVKVIKSAAGVSTRSAIKAVLGGASELLGATKIAGVIGLIIEVGVLLVVFFYTWFSNDIAWGSIAANTLIAGLVSSIVIAVILFVIGLTVIGAIIVGILAVIDLILLGICAIVNAIEGRESCNLMGPIALFTEALGRLIYSGGLAIDTEGYKMLRFRSLDIDLLYPELGLRAGNSLVYRSVIETMIRHRAPESLSTAWHYADELFSADALRQTTFKYELDDEKRTLTAARGEQTGDWQNVKPDVIWTVATIGEVTLHKGEKLDDVRSSAIPLEAGINRRYRMYLNMGAALPSYDCWFGSCETQNTVTTSDSSSLGDPLIYDVFPATLDDFYTLTGSPGSQGLAWGQDGFIRFGRLHDADGDGLLSSGHGGPDPDDTRADTDGDGLPDPAELEFGSDPRTGDTDGDGLSDAAEFRLETNPRAADSDNDGLSDAAEVEGWRIEYAAGAFTRVTANPNERDSDGDGLSDLLEYNLGGSYHPRVENDSPVALYAEIDDADGYLRPAADLVYTAIARNELTRNWLAYGSYTMTAPAVLGSVQASTDFGLFRGQGVSLARALTVDAAASSQRAAIHNAVAADVLAPPLYQPAGALAYTDDFAFTVDNDAPASRLAGVPFVAAGGRRVLGIEATDPSSFVTNVDVQIDGGDWFSATRDGAYWAFEWDVPEAEGAHTLRTRATDAVGWAEAPAETTIYVDANPPVPTTSLTGGAVFAARRNAEGQWAITLSGTATDPEFGSPASGVGSVEVHLTPEGAGWQPATVVTSTSPNTWTIDYELPLFGGGNMDLTVPDGIYTVTVRARDRAGNLTPPASVVTRHVRLDNAPPVASLDALDGVTAISQTVALAGTITDTGVGAGALEVALVPAEMVEAIDEPLVLLPLDEPPAATHFEDRSGQGNDFACWPGQCPTSDVPGRYNAAARFDGAGQYLDRAPLDLPETGYSLALWFKTACADCGLASADRGREAAEGHDRDVFLDGGKVCANVQTGPASYETICTPETTFADGEWHQAVHVIGAGGQQLFVDGTLRVRGFATQSTFTGQNGFNLGFAPAAASDFLAGELDEVALYNTALLPDQIAALYRSWQPATLAQPGAASSAWSYDVPPGVEGFYQIDLRGTDALGNRNDQRITWNAWRGEIDTLAPRVAVTVTYSGAGESAQTTYTGFAEDINLSEVDFEFPCALEAGDRGYYDTAFWNTWSNETTRLHRLTPSCTVAGFQTDDVLIRACDANGLCAAATPPRYLAFGANCAGATDLCFEGEAGEIVQLNLGGHAERQILVEGLEGPTGIGADVERGKVYWTESHSGLIRRANLDGSELETLRETNVTAGSAFPLALDVPGNKLYWGNGRSIWRANLDGSQPVQLLTINTVGVRRSNRVYDIELDPASGKILWVQGGTLRMHGSLWQADITTGANVQQLRQGPSAIALDAGTDTLYWVQERLTIQHATLGALDAPVTLPSDDRYGKSIALAPEANRLYWSSHAYLNEMQLDGTDRRQVGLMGTWPQHIDVARVPARVITTTDLALTLRDVPNLAVHGRAITYELTVENRGVLNATGVTLRHALPAGIGFTSATPACASDGATPPTLTCELGTVHDGETVTVTIVGLVDGAATGTLVARATVTADQADHDPANNTAAESTTATAPPTLPTGYVANFLYASDAYTGAVLRFNLDAPGTWATPDAPITQGEPGSLAIDGAGRKVYWADRWTEALYRADLDGGNAESLPVGPGYKRALALDPARGKLYWIRDFRAILRANLDGSGVETVIPESTGWQLRTGLAVNSLAGEFYWADRGVGTIYRSDLDGSDVRALITGLENPHGLALDAFDNRIYWRSDTAIQRAFLDGSGVETLRAVTGHTSFGRIPLHVDPLHGKLYWTGTEAGGTLWQADLDGSNAISLASGIRAEGFAAAYLPDPAFVDAFEPNPDFLRAARIAGDNPFAASVSLTATLFPAGDADVYALPALAGQRLTLDLTNLPEDYDLALFRPGGELAAESAQGGTAAEQIVQEADRSGEWFVRVSGTVTSALAYTLRAQTTFTHAHEPNETFAQAAALLPGTPVTATLHPQGDVDTYAFSAALDERIVLDLRDLPEDYDLALYRPDQSLMATSAQSGTSAERIDVLADQGGTWYAQITEGAAQAQAPAAASLAPYHLLARFLAVAPDAYEANETFDEAAELLPTLPVTANLYPTGDVDVFSFTVAAGQQIALDLYDLPEDYDLALHRPDQSLAASSAQPGSADERIVTLADQSGAWFARVTGSAPSHREYGLHAALVTPAPDAYEPNETALQATAIPTGTVITATLSPIADADWYRFPAPAGQQIVVNLYDLPENLELALYRPDQSLAATSALGGLNAEKIIFNADQAGDWYVQVTGAAARPGGTASPWPYSLEVALPALTYTHIQWANHSQIGRAEIAGCDDGACITYVVTDTFVSGLALDALNDTVYWTGGPSFQNGLWRANFDGSDAQRITPFTGNRGGVALDTVNGHVYWSDSFSNTIKRAELDGANAVTLTTVPNPDMLALDPDAGTLYWVQDGSAIWRADLADVDGTKAQFIVSDTFGIALDLVNDRLYWTDSDFTNSWIYRADLADGGNVQRVISDTGYFQGIAIDEIGGLMYWIDADFPNTIERATLDGTARTTVLAGGDLSLRRALALELGYPQVDPPERIAPPQATIAEPASGATLVSTDTLTVRGFVLAPASAKALTVTVNGSRLYTETWAQDVTTNTAWSTPWTPPGEGDFALLAVAEDWAGVVQTETVPVTVTVDLSGTVGAPGEPGVPPGYTPAPLASAIVSPAHESVLTALAPVTVTGNAYAGDFLQALTVTVNGDPFYAGAWGSGVLTQTQWAQAWTPPAEGVYTFRSTAGDHAGQVQTATQETRVTVDAAAPALAITQAVLTATHRFASGRFDVPGRVTDTVGVEAVEVRVDGGPWGAASVGAVPGPWRYPWHLGLGNDPDGVAYTFEARARDAAGRVAQTTESVTVDVVPPAPVTVTLAYTDGLGARHTITPGQTVTEAAPTLIITWTAGSDGSGIAGYRAGWSASAAPDPAALASFGAGDARHHTHAPGEAQVLYAHVAIDDAHGNRRYQILGPVYVDAPTTPDLVALDYHGWMDSGASQLSADHEIARGAAQHGDAGVPQRFYLTWNDAALRMAWRGANWDHNGDLFVYLDTAPGGATALHNPYTATATTTVGLPDGFNADRLLWIEDSATASLLAWDGGGWVISASLSAAQYRLAGDLTDLRLDFADLGIDGATPVGVLAVASEEDGLRLWAAAPDKNPLNSARVINPLALGRDLSGFDLTQYHTWAALAPGARPNAARFAESDLRLSLAAEPTGVTVGYLGSDLLDLLSPGQRLDGDGDGEIDGDLPLDVEPYPLYDGQTLTFTLRYANDGPAAAPDVVVTATALGVLSFAAGSEAVMALGDVAPGISGTHALTAVVNAVPGTPSAELNAVVDDGVHRPYDWLWVQHDVDTDPPTVTLTSPQRYARPYTQTVTGLAEDASGVPQITVQARSQPGGAVTEVTCADATPRDGQWACAWNAGAAAGVDAFEIRARGTDSFGTTGPWTGWVTLSVDTAPPTVTFDAALDAALADGYLSADEARITGQVIDDLAARRARHCTPDEGGAICATLTVRPGTAPTGTWSLDVPTEGADGITHTLTLYGYDAVGNRSTPHTRAFRVDAVAPAITVTTGGAHPASGLVSDGGAVAAVRGIVAGLGSDLSVITATLTGGTWMLTLPPGAPAGSYTVWIEAEDRAGNTRETEALEITVGFTGGPALYLPLVTREG